MPRVGRRVFPPRFEFRRRGVEFREPAEHFYDACTFVDGVVAGGAPARHDAPPVTPKS